MRIGIFTDQFYPLISGVVTSIKMLYEGLEELGHEVYVITFHTGDDNLDDKQKNELNKFKVLYVDGHKYPFKAVSDYKFTFKKKKAVKSIGTLNLDIIHVQTEFSIASIAKRVSKKYHIPMVHTLHTSYKDYIRYVFPKLDKLFHPLLVVLFRRLFTHPIIKRVSYEIVPTDKVIKDFKLYYKKKKDIAIIPTGIDIKSFSDSNTDYELLSELKNKYNLNDKFVFIYVGRTSSEKNIKEIIKGFSKAFIDNDNVRFLLVGGGPELDELIQCAKDNNVYDKMIFTGLVEMDLVHNYYKLGNVFLNASKSETQGLTYIEALAAGTIPLVRNDEAINGVIINEVNGYTFEKFEELTNRMQFLYNNKDDLEKIKNNSNEILNKYSKEAFVNSILDIYNKILNNKG